MQEIAPSATTTFTARHYATGEWLRVTHDTGRILELTPAAAAAEEAWIAPALFDVQVNGFAGVDFQQDDLNEASLLQAARGLRDAACGKFLLTLVTAPWEKLIERVRRVRALREASPELGWAIAGFHVEGPFLSSKPGYVGAHDPGCMMDPEPAHIEALRDAAGSVPVMLTLAPERSGAIAAIRAAVANRMIVSLGHTDAGREELEAAIAAGAKAFTHLGNACPKELDRHDNIVLRALDMNGRLTVGLIADRIHVSPAFFRLVHRALPLDAIYYTTDAMAAAGAPPGRYTIGSLTVEVGPDQIVRQPGKTNFAGSALRPLDGVVRAAEMLGVTWREAWPAFSARPARLVGIDVEVRQGADAFCVVRPRAQGLVCDVFSRWNTMK